MGHAKITKGQKMKKKEIYGESYYRVGEIQEFIKKCERDKDIILSIEFFDIINEKVIPYGLLQSIDSAELYDERKSAKENIEACNNFIKSCVDKYSKKLENLYFSATIENLG